MKLAIFEIFIKKDIRNEYSESIDNILCRYLSSDQGILMIGFSATIMMSLFRKGQQLVK